MHYLSVVIVAIVLASLVTGSPSNCSNTYQQLMDQAAAVKRTCSEAALKDCCQVSETLCPPGEWLLFAVDDVFVGQHHPVTSLIKVACQHQLLETFSTRVVHQSPPLASFPVLHRGL